MIEALLILAAVGSGLMAGLFGSFSSFLMRALAQLPDAQGAAAMQAINVVIVRPLFLLVFFGTGVAGVATVILGGEGLGENGRALVAAGAGVYVLGCLGVTMACNVPLNNRLAAVAADSEEGAEMWRRYLVEWVRWNHVRSVATLASTALLVGAALC